MPPESPSSGDLLSAAGGLAGQGFGAAVGVVRDTHRAISGRVFWALGLAGAPMRLATLPVRLIHDTISELVYGVTGNIGETVLRIGGELTALIAAGQEAGVRARLLLAVLNGMFGDRLARDRSPLATEMIARVDGEPTPKLAVFVHGLCETEDAWFLWRNRWPGASVYGDRLHVALDWTPVYVRYNTGLPIEENGRQLASLVSELVASAPREVTDVALIGHSMGGLVAREALLAGRRSDWAERVRHLVTLGTPHRGAPLEQAAEAAARVLSWVPETRPLAEALGVRSAGIKDLRHGPGERCEQEIDHYFFSAGLGSGLEPILGDLLVPRRSAWDQARGEDLGFGSDHYRHLGDANHFDLLGHPAIGQQLVSWLGGPGLIEA
ncbi:MAG: hypothetical protein J2O48_09025 [Solirubrobacterales bacterium]|nr:hypothetical protein [Solirubrobacterales bacterium]